MTAAGNRNVYKSVRIASNLERRTCFPFTRVSDHALCERTLMRTPSRLTSRPTRHWTARLAGSEGITRMRRFNLRFHPCAVGRMHVLRISQSAADRRFEMLADFDQRERGERPRR